MDEYNLVVSWFDQLIVVLSGYVIKPLYMTLTCVLLYRLRSYSAKDMRFLKCGVAGFLVGESICAANYYISGSINFTLEILHGFGMVWALIFIPWSVYIFLDERIFHFSSTVKRCGMQPFCGSCGKHESSGCGMEKLIVYLTPALIILALMAFSHPLDPYQYSINVFDSTVLFVSSTLAQIIEIRAYSVVAIVLLLAGGFSLKIKKDANLWACFFFPGFGFMMFSLFRFFLTFTFHANPVWSNFWEEMSELLLILSILVCMGIFRKQLSVK